MRTGRPLVIPDMVRPVTAAQGIVIPAVQRNTLPFKGTVAANTRQQFFSSRYNEPIRLETIRSAFAINTQRTLRLRFWACPSNTTYVISTNHTMPSGINLMAQGGDAVDYIVGDGQEGEIVTRRMLDLPAGWFLCVDADNTDANPHTVDVNMDVLSLPRILTGQATRFNA